MVEHAEHVLRSTPYLKVRSKSKASGIQQHQCLERSSLVPGTINAATSCRSWSTVWSTYRSRSTAAVPQARGKQLPVYHVFTVWSTYRSRSTAAVPRTRGKQLLASCVDINILPPLGNITSSHHHLRRSDILKGRRDTYLNMAAVSTLFDGLSAYSRAHDPELPKHQGNDCCALLELTQLSMLHVECSRPA